jgi:hypothetical protein
LLGLAATPQEANGQHAECKGPAGEHHRLSPGETFKIGDNLTGITLAQIPTESLHLFGTAIGIRGQRGLCAFLAKMLAGLAKRLGNSCGRLGNVVLAHVEPGCHLLDGLVHDRGTLFFAAQHPAGGFLDFVDDLPCHMMGSVSDLGCRFAGRASWCRHRIPIVEYHGTEMRKGRLERGGIELLSDPHVDRCVTAQKSERTKRT